MCDHTRHLPSLVFKYKIHLWQFPEMNQKSNPILFVTLIPIDKGYFCKKKKWILNKVQEAAFNQQTVLRELL
jgi:hypothetical protein